MRILEAVRFAVLCLAFLSPCFGYAYDLDRVVSTDSRIKIFIYDENTIYNLKFRVGYQTIIQFGKGEEIELVAVGSPYHWKVDPIETNIFVEPVDPGVVTNMTVKTNKHLYMFQISSTVPSSAGGVHDALFMVRFFYPDKRFTDASDFSNSEVINSSLVGGVSKAGGANNYPEAKQLNIRYSYQGSETPITPVEVFDNRQRTYIRFKPDVDSESLIIRSIAPSGEYGTALNTHIDANFVSVDGVYYALSITDGQSSAIVFNDGLSITEESESISNVEVDERVRTFGGGSASFAEQPHSNAKEAKPKKKGGFFGSLKSIFVKDKSKKSKRRAKASERAAPAAETLRVDEYASQSQGSFSEERADYSQSAASSRRRSVGPKKYIINDENAGIYRMQESANSVSDNEFRQAFVSESDASASVASYSEPINNSGAGSGANSADPFQAMSGGAGSYPGRVGPGPSSGAEKSESYRMMFETAPPNGERSGGGGMGGLKGGYASVENLALDEESSGGDDDYRQAFGR